MNFYIETLNTDPSYNLALEQFVFDHLDQSHDYFMLWQNDRSVIIGKNQNTIEEINLPYIKEHNMNVVRRLSGGGAVYHDLGNINFTFITDAVTENPVDFHAFCEPIKKALISFGVPVVFNGRNDMTVNEKKISGNAQYKKNKRVMHHGTLLYDADLEALSKALNVANDKIESKGIKSVKSRVTNIRPYMKTDMPVSVFFEALKNYFISNFNMKKYQLSVNDETEIEKIKDKVYSQWSWNYGASPPYNIRKVRRIDGCGKIEVLLDMGKDGVILNAAFYGDFFGENDNRELAALLIGCRLVENELKNKLRKIGISRYFNNLDAEGLISMLLE
ncbi:MAG: lipoate--protein ligase [Treponema sp.]|nr:lipoate--protein ligase [Treponema sp.]